MTKPDTRSVVLRWTGEGLAFRGGPQDGVQIGVDGDREHGQSPMELLLMSLAGCMAIDVLMILEKSRVTVDDLEVEVTGERADSVPKRYTSVTLVYRLTGPTEDDRDKVDRSIELSRDRYCSVLHTLDGQLDVDIRVELG